MQGGLTCLQRDLDPLHKGAPSRPVQPALRIAVACAAWQRGGRDRHTCWSPGCEAADGGHTGMTRSSSQAGHAGATLPLLVLWLQLQCCTRPKAAVPNSTAQPALTRWPGGCRPCPARGLTAPWACLPGLVCEMRACLPSADRAHGLLKGGMVGAGRPCRSQQVEPGMHHRRGSQASARGVWVRKLSRRSAGCDQGCTGVPLHLHLASECL